MGTGLGRQHSRQREQCGQMPLGGGSASCSRNWKMMLRPVVKVGSGWPQVNEIQNKVLMVKNNGIDVYIKNFGLNS